MKRRLGILAASLIASLALAAPAQADGPTRHPLDPHKPPQGVYIVPKPPMKGGVVWTCKVYRGHWWLVVVCYPTRVR